MSTENTKKMILEFLQKKKLDLINQVPGFVDARLEEQEDGPVLLLLVDVEIEGDVQLVHKGETLPVVVRVNEVTPEDSAKAVVVVVNSEDGIKPVVQDGKEEDGVGVISLPNEVAINPHDNRGAKNQASLEAWRQRHRHVKVR